MLKYENSTVQFLFDKKEFDFFSSLVQKTAGEFPDINGVLLTGSLVQRIRLPDSLDGEVLDSRQGAYREIVTRSKRKFFPHPDSDLDIWLLISDLDKYRDSVPRVLDERALDLIDWYSGQGSVDLVEWVGRKHLALDDFYKKDFLFPKSWVRDNVVPYYGVGFKETLVDNVGSELRVVRDRIKGVFNRNYPRDFLEVRAFPSAVFNLRPEKIVLDGVVDRTPFPYFLRDWLDLEQNCLVLYRNGGDLIYPFDEGGVVRGQRVADELCWSERHVGYCYSKRGGAS